MAVIKRSLLYFLLSLLISWNNVWAAFISKSKVVFNFYSQSGDQGEQIYSTDQKEDVTVFEPMVFMEHQIDESTSINAHFVIDTWTAASDTQLDGNTGASGEEGVKGQSRTAAQISYNKKSKKNEWSIRGGFSTEHDYQSINMGANYQQRFAQDNFTIALSGQLFLDKAKTFDLVADNITDFQDRTIYSLDLTMSQLLTRSDIIQLGFTYINMDGMLNNISNTVYVASNPYSNTLSRVEEQLPTTRERFAVKLSEVHGFTDSTALHSNYRYYNDSWGVVAHTAELALAQSFHDDDVFLKLSYRYYDQTAVKYYAQSFATQQSYMTSDSDMEAFDGHRFGVHADHNLGEKSYWGVDLNELTLGAAVYHYTRSNDLKYTIVQLGVNAEF